MGDMGRATRRSHHATHQLPASPLRSSPKKKMSADATAARTRSTSSPPYRARSGSRDSETQSSSDTEIEQHHFSQSSPNSTRVDESISGQNPCSRSPKKPVGKRNHSGLAHLPLTPSVPTMLGLVGILVAIPMLLVIAQFLSTGNVTQHSDLRSLGDIEDDIIRDLEKLRSETKQEMSFWRSVFSGLTTMTEQAPRQPLVLLMAVPIDASQTAVCLAHHLTDIVTKAFEGSAPVKHDTLGHLHMAWDDHKLALDDRLKSLASTRAAVIYNLEKMPPKTATLLHGYFDNDNAPHKRALIVVLLELELHYTSVSEAHLDLTVERRLHELWRQDLAQDDIPGLISRVAVQPLLVKPESKLLLQKLCPL